MSIDNGIFIIATSKGGDGGDKEYRVAYSNTNAVEDFLDWRKPGPFGKSPVFTDMNLAIEEAVRIRDKEHSGLPLEYGIRYLDFPDEDFPSENEWG